MIKGIFTTKGFPSVRDDKASIDSVKWIKGIERFVRADSATSSQVPRVATWPPTRSASPSECG